MSLRRTLGLLETVALGTGVIIGAGIYVLIGQAAQLAGVNVWISLVIAGVVAGLTAVSYIELSSRYPFAGSSYVYVKDVLKSRWLGFIVGWAIIWENIVGAATVALGFSSYFGAMVAAPQTVVLLALFAVVAAILLRGVKETAAMNIVMSVFEVGGLLLVIAVGLLIGTKTIPIDFSVGIDNVVAASGMIFFAYLGFELIATSSEETRAARRTVPKAILLSLLISTVLYVLVALSLAWLVPVADMNDVPMAKAVARLSPALVPVIGIMALMATLNTVLVMAYGTSRISYGMARGGELPRVFSRVHSSRRTPYVATLLVVALALAFALWGDIGFVARASNFGALFAFCFVNISAVVLRTRTWPLSLLGLLASLWLMWSLGPDIVAIGLSVIGIGIAMHVALNRQKRIKKR